MLMRWKMYNVFISPGIQLEKKRGDNDWREREYFLLSKLLSCPHTSADRLYTIYILYMLDCLLTSLCSTAT